MLVRMLQESLGRRSRAPIELSLLRFGTETPLELRRIWNSAHFRGTPSGGLKAPWIPKGLLDDATLYQSFIEMMRRRVFVSQPSSGLCLISYDEDEAQLRRITKQIITDFKWNMHTSDPVVRNKRELPEFKPRAAVTALFANRSARPDTNKFPGRAHSLNLFLRSPMLSMNLWQLPSATTG
jgi:hypothetical protein